MALHYYKIADSVLCLKAGLDIDLSYFDSFSIEESEPDFTVEFVPFDRFKSLVDSKGTTIYGVECLETSLEGWAHSFKAVSDESTVYLACNEDWSYGILGFSNERISFQDMPSWAGVLLLGFYTRICHKNILMMHASAVDKDGRGIIFIGPSNIGKTTQAELWQEYENAEILNGDKIFLQVDGDSVTVFGNPWKGSSPYFLNRSVPLQGAIVLRQSSENEIHEIAEEERLMKLLPHVFLPHWDLDGLSVSVSSLDMWLSNHKVYQLSCKPDQEAVCLVRDILDINE